MAESVWLVVPKAVYYHQPAFVGRTLADAEAFCDEWAPDDDGHHRWVIFEMRVGEAWNHEPFDEFDHNTLTRWEDQRRRRYGEDEPFRPAREATQLLSWPVPTQNGEP